MSAPELRRWALDRVAGQVILDPVTPIGGPRWSPAWPLYDTDELAAFANVYRDALVVVLEYVQRCGLRVTVHDVVAELKARDAVADVLDAADAITKAAAEGVEGP